MDCWRTSEGNEIPVNRMSDGHVRNAYAFLGRQLEADVRLGEALTEDLHGHLDGDFVHDEYEGVFDMEIAAVLDENARVAARARMLRDWRQKFRREAKRRGVELPEDTVPW